MEYRVYNLGSLNLGVSPFNQNPGDLLRSVNIETDEAGVLTKRPGYITTLGTANGSAVVDLFAWQKDDGTTTILYRNSGGVLYSSTQGTGAWTATTNGTITAGVHVGHAVLENTLMIGQNSGTMRHSTSGTAFTDTSGAPGVGYLASKFNRIWAWGTSSDLTYSTQGTPSDWVSDSSSLKVPGAGKGHGLFVCNDRLVAPKNSGLLFTYDDYNLRQVPTDQGPSSPTSLGEIEGVFTYLNRDGVWGYGGDRPKLLSIPVEKLLYNNSGSAVAGTAFDGAAGIGYRLDYYLSLGTTTENVTGETINDCVLKYDTKNGGWTTFSYANFPTSWATYIDNDGNQQLVFGASNGQCYKVAGTATSDNGSPIESIGMGVLHFGVPEADKDFHWIDISANPGCQAKVAVAVAGAFRKEGMKWRDVGDLSTGSTRYYFPDKTRGKLLFWKIYDYSESPPWKLYGFTVNLDVVS